MGGACVSIVILNWNGWEDTIKCLESVMALESPRRKVVVVDNGSSDGSVDEIRTWANRRARGASIEDIFPLIEYDRQTAENGGEPEKELQLKSMTFSTPLVLIRAQENIGYARGNNIGIDYIMRSNRSDYILVLNNDTLLERDSLELMIQGLSKYPSAGVVGPKILDYFDGSEWQWPVAKRLDFGSICVAFTGLNRLFRLSKLFRKFYESSFYLGNEEHQVYAIPGSCMCFRREALEVIGGFDQETFLYWEEFIVAEKLLANSYETYFIPESRILHKLGASTTKLGARLFIENMLSENYYFLEYQHFSRIQVLTLKSFRLGAYLMRCVVSKDYRGRWRDFLSALIGVNSASGWGIRNRAALLAAGGKDRLCRGEAGDRHTSVVLVSGSLPPEACGVGDYAYRLGGAFAKEAICVRVLTTITSEVRVDLDLDIAPTVRRWSLVGFWGLFRQIAVADPDIVHLQYPTAAYGAGLLPQLLVLTRRPLVVTIHEASCSHILRRLSLYPFLAFADRIVATTSFEAKYLARMYPPIRRRLSVIRVASAIPAASPRVRDCRVVVYFGLISPDKGLEEFLSLARSAQDAGERWDFRIIGKVPHKRQLYAETLREASEGLRLAWHIDLPEDQVAELLAGAGVAYLPFPDGASGRRSSLAASLVNGLPTVTTRGAATPTGLVARENILFADSPEAALGSIREIFSDRLLSQNLSSGALRYSKGLSWERIAEQYAALYNSMLG